MPQRHASHTRKTTETDVRVSLSLDGSGSAHVATGIGFFDHMLQLLAHHGQFDLEVTAQGDLHVDQHHTVEDVGIGIGQAVKKALGDKEGIQRYGHFTLPMDETLCTVAVDMGGRYAMGFRAEFPTEKIGEFDTELVDEFCKAFASNALCNLHVLVHYGRNSHHMSEAIFKTMARAIRMAIEFDTRASGIPSTKGILSE